jgi:hypothetical protein
VTAKNLIQLWRWQTILHWTHPREWFYLGEIALQMKETPHFCIRYRCYSESKKTGWKSKTTGRLIGTRWLCKTGGSHIYAVEESGIPDVKQCHWLSSFKHFERYQCFDMQDKPNPKHLYSNWLTLPMNVLRFLENVRILLAQRHGVTSKRTCIPFKIILNDDPWQKVTSRRVSYRLEILHQDAPLVKGVCNR